MKSEKETHTSVLFRELEDVSQGHKSYQNFLSERKSEKTFNSLKYFLDDYFFQHTDITPSTIIKDSNLSKNYVYPICNGRKNPSKYKLVALCIGAHMTLKETQKALSLAGCAQLHPKIPADSGIIVCINQKYKNIGEVDLFLDKNGVKSPFLME